MKIIVAPRGKRSIMLRYGFGPAYAEKGGGLVLRHEVTWKKLSGFWINTIWGCVWVMIRRASW